MQNVHVKLNKLGGALGDESFNLSGTVITAGGTPVDLEPATRGFQVLLEDLGATPSPLVDFTAATDPVPPGVRDTGCDPGDGWNGLVYKNRSNSIDPPACTIDSAHGLQKVRLRDRRAKGGGIFFQVAGRRASLPVPVGRLRLTVVFGADAATGAHGECSSFTFLAADCHPKRGAVRCK
jgi:hypothetical protein